MNSVKHVPSFMRSDATPHNLDNVELGLLTYAAVVALAETLSADDNDRLQQFTFLRGYCDEIDGYMRDRDERPSVAFWCREADIHAAANLEHERPATRLRRDCGLDDAGVLALMLAGLPEQDSRFGDLFAHISGDDACRYPNAELVARILVQGGLGAAGAQSVVSALLEYGFLEPLGGVGAIAIERPLRLPSLVWSALSEALFNTPPPGLSVVLKKHCRRIPTLHYPPGLLTRLEAVPGALEESNAACLLIRHDPGADVQELAGALAREQGQHLLVVGQWQDGKNAALGAAARILNAQVLIERELGPGETMHTPDLGRYGQAPIVAIGRTGGLDTRLDESKVTLDIPFPTVRERLRIWRDALTDIDLKDLAFLAERFQIPAGYIRTIARDAVGEAALAGAAGIERQHVLAASRQLNRQQLDVLAEPLKAEGDWSWFVTRDITVAQLNELAGRCRKRETLKEAVSESFSATLGRGVRALFTGPSGTGKTMAARIMAQQLGYDIYRIDLGAVVNKYVGETEKNLHKVLSYAEALDVILLLDEGDALLGQRTDVKSANDRYANLETNYLLQRFESYQGIVFVTTNLGDNIDRAFKRRMDIVVPFFTPRAEERARLWSTHLPINHGISPDFLDRVIRQCVLTGGQIRNAVAQAGALALELGGVVNDLCLQQALVREHQKAGTVYALDESASESQDGGFDSFVSLLHAVPGRRS